MIPVQSIEQIGLRKIITDVQADQILLFLNDAEVDWDKDFRQRKQSYEATIKGNDLFEIARMVKELMAQEQKSVLGNFEKELLPRAKKRLFSEIALAKGLDFEETLQLAFCSSR